MSKITITQLGTAKPNFELVWDKPSGIYEVEFTNPTSIFNGPVLLFNESSLLKVMYSVSPSDAKFGENYWTNQHSPGLKVKFLKKYDAEIILTEVR